MRIAYLLTQDRGGPVDVTTRLVATLRERGHDAVLFGPEPARGAVLVRGAHVPVTVGRKGDLRAARGVRAALRDFAPDLVHAQDRRAGLVLAGARRTPVVHTYHGVPEDVSLAWFAGVRGAAPPSRYTRAVLAGDAVLARSLTRTVVPAEAMARFLRSRLRVPPARIEHIDNGVLPGPAGPPVRRVRRLLFVGLLVPRKGFPTLLEAIARPGVMPADAVLDVAGDGPALAGARAYLDGPGAAVRGRVRFLGFRADVPHLVRASDALVLPSEMEQQPVAIAEAMAAGRPVVATDTGGVREMLDVPGAAGFLVPPGDPVALAGALTRLFGTTDASGYGAALRERALTRYTASGCAQAHLRLYGSALAQHRAGVRGQR